MGATEARRTYSNQLPSSTFCSQHLLKGATATNRNENDLLQHDHRGAKGHIKNAQSASVEYLADLASHRIKPKRWSGWRANKGRRASQKKKNLSFVCTAETRRRCTCPKCPP